MEKEEGINVVVSGNNGTVVSVKNRESSLLGRKIEGCLLAVHTISSLDDAIDLANSSPSPLTASFIFSALPAAKYMSQFISANASFINQAPTELLVGPVAPADYPVSLKTRYSRAMFEIPRTQIVQTTRDTEIVNAVLRDSDLAQLKELRKRATVVLPPTGQKEGGSIGFFEQGIITGGLIVMTPILTTVVALGYFGVSAALRRVR